MLQMDFKPRRAGLHMLALLMIITVLAACGTNTSPADKESSSQNGKSTVTKIELLVSAADSLKNSLEKIEPKFRSKHPNISLVFNYGPSGMLQKQIEEGVPADLFLSAGMKQMDALIEKQLIDQSTVWLENDLIVVSLADSPRTLSSLSELASNSIIKIAVGQPDSVPTGQYAQEALTESGLWETLQDKLVFAKDVRQVLHYVETGNVDVGFVYRTDALVSKKVVIVHDVDPSLHKPIIYPAGIIKNAAHAEEAAAFYQYLQTEEAQKIFKQYGFSLPE